MPLFPATVIIFPFCQQETETLECSLFTGFLSVYVLSSANWEAVGRASAWNERSRAVSGKSGEESACVFHRHKDKPSVSDAPSGAALPHPSDSTRVPRARRAFALMRSLPNFCLIFFQVLFEMFAHLYRGHFIMAVRLHTDEILKGKSE